MMHMTFTCIRTERTVRRQCGRILAASSPRSRPDSITSPLFGVQKPLELRSNKWQLAVSVREVASVSRVGTLLSM